jgi:hypothetical protein
MSRLGQIKKCTVWDRCPDDAPTTMWMKMAREDDSSGLRAGNGPLSTPRRLVTLACSLELQMDATRSAHDLIDQAASKSLPAPRSSSVSRTPATSVDDDYGQRVWVRSRVKPRPCPRCNSTATQRSHRQGIFERILLSLLPVRPFRCRDCDWRFYGWLFNMQTIRSKIPVARRSNLD